MPPNAASLRRIYVVTDVNCPSAQDTCGLSAVTEQTCLTLTDVHDVRCFPSRGLANVHQEQRQSTSVLTRG